MIIPGWIIAVLTFPGVIVHEAAHMLFCKWRRVTILDVCFFQFRNPVGYVLHEDVRDFTSAFLIAVGPLAVNSLLCILICFPASLPVEVFSVESPLNYVLMWLGISIGMHAFPSTQDARNLWNHAKMEVKTMNPLALLSFPLVILIFIANILSVVWLDHLYGFALGFWLPSFLFGRLL
ncbi:MAG: DUF3267 domain-containing protein [Acidobacteriota bacterium]